MKPVLLLDAGVNFALGIILVFYSPAMAAFFDLPLTSSIFYPQILGAIFIGIAAALTIEVCKKNRSITGLGLFGALTINLCGGTALLLWLVFGDLQLHLKGLLILWTLAVFLFLISGVELFLELRRKKG